MNDDILDHQKDEVGLHSSVEWWESMRLRFNLIVLAPGLFTMFVLLSFDPQQLPIIIIGSLFYGLIVNACYCLGWILEQPEVHYLKRQPILRKYRMALFVLGTILSIGITAIPEMLGIVVQLF